MREQRRVPLTTGNRGRRARSWRVYAGGLVAAAAVICGAFATASLAAPGSATSRTVRVTALPFRADLIGITSPRAGLVPSSAGGVTVALKGDRSVRSVSVQINGRRVPGAAVRRRGSGRWTIRLRARDGLARGTNYVTVDAASRHAEGFASVVFRYASPARGLAQIITPAPGFRARSAPVAVILQAAQGVSVTAWLNGSRLRGNLTDVCGLACGRGPVFIPDLVGASDGLRYGDNLLVMRAYRAGRYQIVRRTFTVTRARPLPGAGLNRNGQTGIPLRLNGTQSRPMRRGMRLSYRWRILRAPRGSRAKLRGATTARPWLTPDVRGTYKVGLVVSGRGRARTASAAAVSSGEDSVTVAAADTFPLQRLYASVPIAPNCSGITIGRDQVGATPATYKNPGCNAPVQVLVLDRKTLEVKDNQSFRTAQDLLNYVNGVQTTYGASGALVVINIDPGPDAPGTCTISSCVGPPLNKAIQDIGGVGYPIGADLASGGLIVGAPGWQTGNGFQSADPGSVAPSSLTGFFVLDNNNQYRFQATAGQVQYDTADGGSSGDMNIAGNVYSMTPATDPRFSEPLWQPGDPYVHVVAVRADSPQVRLVEAAFAVDTLACVGGNPANGCTFDRELKRMLGTLTPMIGNRSILLFVQTVGSVYRFNGNANIPQGSDYWYEVGDVLGKLGGSAWVWDNMPTASGQSGNQNAYALVGGQAVADEHRVDRVEIGGQIPDPWTGGSGPSSLQGVLALNNVGWFTPSQGLPTDDATPSQQPFGPSLSQIAYEPPTAWPMMSTQAERDAYNWIDGQAPNLHFKGDLRADYYGGTDNASWSDVIDVLQHLTPPCEPSGSCDEPGGSFTLQDFTDVRDQLVHELGDVDSVNKWFQTVETPLVNTQGTALAVLQDYAGNLLTDLKPPQGDAVRWATFALGLIGDVTGFGGLAEGELGKAFFAFSQSLATASTIASSSDPSGDPITGVAETTVSQLALALSNNTQATLNSMERLREILVSDWGKLQQVAPLMENGGDWWPSQNDLNVAVQHIKVGLMRQAYEAVLPAIGTVYQIWPADVWSLNNRAVLQSSAYRCSLGNVDSSGKPFGYWGGTIPTTHSEPASADPRVSLWPDNYTGTSAQTRPPWSFFVYRLVTSDYGGRSPRASLTDPLSTAPAPKGIFPDDPNVLPGPGFYTPWLFSGAFTPQPFNCTKWKQ